MLNEEEQSTLKALGDSIATAAQNVLLNNVATAIQKAGTELFKKPEQNMLLNFAM